MQWCYFWYSPMLEPSLWAGYLQSFSHSNSLKSPIPHRWDGCISGFLISLWNNLKNLPKHDIYVAQKMCRDSGRPLYFRWLSKLTCKIAHNQTHHSKCNLSKIIWYFDKDKPSQRNKKGLESTCRDSWFLRTFGSSSCFATTLLC